MTDCDKQRNTPTWPPPVLRTVDQSQAEPESKVRRLVSRTPYSIIFGLLCGSILYFLCGIVLFGLVVKLQVLEMTNGFSLQIRVVSLYIARLSEILCLLAPLVLYFRLRRHYSIFASSLLIGSVLVVLFFLKLFLIGL